MTYTIKTNPKSTLDKLIEQGKYNYKYINPDYKLPKAKATTREFELVQEKNLITTQELWDKYGDSLASVREVLEFGIKYPDEQRKNWIIGLEKQGDAFWYAFLRSFAGYRRLGVYPGHPVDQWFDICRFLRRKSSGKLGASEPLVSWPLDTLEINGIKYRRV